MSALTTATRSQASSRLPSDPYISSLINFRPGFVIPTPSREGAGCPFQCAAFSFTPSPVPNCPACKPNSGSRFPSLSTKAHSSRGGPTSVCNHVDFHLETGGFRESGDSRKPTGPSDGSDVRVWLVAALARWGSRLGACLDQRFVQSILTG